MEQTLRGSFKNFLFYYKFRCREQVFTASGKDRKPHTKSPSAGLQNLQSNFIATGSIYTYISCRYRLVPCKLYAEIRRPAAACSNLLLSLKSYSARAHTLASFCIATGIPNFSSKILTIGILSHQGRFGGDRISGTVLPRITAHFVPPISIPINKSLIFPSPEVSGSSHSLLKTDHPVVQERGQGQPAPVSTANLIFVPQEADASSFH